MDFVAFFAAGALLIILLLAKLALKPVSHPVLAPAFFGTESAPWVAGLLFWTHRLRILLE